MRKTSLAILLVIWSSSALLAAKPVGIRVLPETIDLTYENSIQHVTVQTVLSDGTIGPMVGTTPNIQILDPSLVKLESSEPGCFQLTAKRSGTTTLSIEYKLSDGEIAHATATITCRDAEKACRWR